MNEIACIPADHEGNKLWLKEPRQEGNKYFIKYKSTYNDIPFREVQCFSADGGKNLVISGDDGTVIWRFSINWFHKLLAE